MYKPKSSKFFFFWGIVLFLILIFWSRICSRDTITKHTTAYSICCGCWHRCHHRGHHCFRCLCSRVYYQGVVLSQQYWWIQVHQGSPRVQVELSSSSLCLWPTAPNITPAQSLLLLVSCHVTTWTLRMKCIPQKMKCTPYIYISIKCVIDVCVDTYLFIYIHVKIPYLQSMNTVCDFFNSQIEATERNNLYSSKKKKKEKKQTLLEF